MRNSERRNADRDHRPAQWRTLSGKGGRHRKWPRAALVATLWLALAGLGALPAFAWEHWGGDAGGTRYAAIGQITPGNVDRLIRAWKFSTGDLAHRDPAVMAHTMFETTPLFVEDSLILCSAFNEVIALDPGTGAQKWRFDPKLSTGLQPGTHYNCRGVAYWVDQAAPAAASCRARIFTGTHDMRVIALDAKTGTPCAGFGAGGEVKLDVGMPQLWEGEIQIVSPPVVVRGAVIVGSYISDNQRTDAPRGTVRALDARTGALRWTWDPLIHDGIEAGAANRRGFGAGIPADHLAKPGFLGRQAAGQ
jgi:quinoprotein glucose dehydrogenase